MTRDNITVRPRGDFVLVRCLRADKSLGGINLPSGEKSFRYFIVALGPDVKQENGPLKVGDRVLLPTLPGCALGFPMPGNFEGKYRDEWMLTKQENIIAVVENWE